MAVSVAVVGQRLSLQRVLGGSRSTPWPLARAVSTARSSAVKRHPRVAAGARGDELERLLGDRRRIGDPALGVRERALEELAHVLGLERMELIDLAARRERRVDLEVRVLGGRPDQGHEPLLDRGQQRVLLRLVEAVDLVQEEDRRLAGRAAPLLGPRDHRPDLGTAGVDRRASSNAPRQAVAMIRARVVFPEPGGPWKTAE